MEAMDKINGKIDRFRNKDDTTPLDSRIPPTIQHATAEICLEGADLLTQDALTQGDVPAADMLQRYGQIQAKLGEARLEFTRALSRKFIEPFSTYTGAYENVNVQSRIIPLLEAPD